MPKYSTHVALIARKSEMMQRSGENCNTTYLYRNCTAMRCGAVRRGATLFGFFSMLSLSPTIEKVPTYARGLLLKKR